MTNIFLPACLLLIALALSPSARADEPAPLPRRLTAPALTTLPLTAIRPTGWLKRQLEIQAGGLTGHLHEFWPDIRDSGWTGGRAEGWERMPYWLDGAVPLAYLLDDAALKEKVSQSIDYILRHQQEDGWLGPAAFEGPNKLTRDPWPVFVMLKVLVQYQEATGDKRVVPAMTKFLRALDKQLDGRPLYEWNKLRWQEAVLSVHWVYDQTGEPWLLALAEKMQRQGYDWRAHMADLPHKQKSPKWDHATHVVNNAMGVKTPAVTFRQTGNAADRAVALSGLDQLDKFHGQAVGVFSGDECLAGRMPSQGTETCAVVEYMFSLEKLMAAFAEPAFGDRLELIAYNALPASCSEDMWTRQYIQQTNQPVSRLAPKPIYTTNGDRANLFGLETNFGCCTANMHQGWPKLATHLWMKNDRGLTAVAYAPSRVETIINGRKVSVELATEYPFRDRLDFTVTVNAPTKFAITLRIPGWAKQPQVTLAGEQPVTVTPNTFHAIDREWKGETRLTLRLPMPVTIERRFNDAATIRRGPLVYSLAVSEEWKVLDGKPPQVTYQVLPKTPWNYALSLDEKQPAASIRFENLPISEVPFSATRPPVKAFVQGKLLPAWKLERDAAAEPPKSPVESDQPLTELTLIPYGCARLRITEFPVLGE